MNRVGIATGRKKKTFTRVVRKISLDYKTRALVNLSRDTDNCKQQY